MANHAVKEITRASIVISAWCLGFFGTVLLTHDFFERLETDTHASLFVEETPTTIERFGLFP